MPGGPGSHLVPPEKGQDTFQVRTALGSQMKVRNMPGIRSGFAVGVEFDYMAFGCTKRCSGAEWPFGLGLCRPPRRSAHRCKERAEGLHKVEKGIKQVERDSSAAIANVL